MRSLAAILRVAIGLDRTHDGRVIAHVSTPAAAVACRSRLSLDRRRHRARAVHRQRTFTLLAEVLGLTVDVTPRLIRPPLTAVPPYHVLRPRRVVIR